MSTRGEFLIWENIDRTSFTIGASNELSFAVVLGIGRRGWVDGVILMDVDGKVYIAVSCWWMLFNI